ALEAPAAALAAAERGRRPGRRRLAMAAAACLLLLLAGGILLRDPPDHATDPGTQATVALADGSRMTLDGDSAAEAAVDAESRRVTLLRGRAFFEVTPDATRPFVVMAGGVETIVLGTAFAVERQGGAVAVVVEHGRVAVREAHAQVELADGEMVEASAGALGAPGPAALASALAWRRGLLAFEDRTLAEVAAELDRADGGRVVIPQAGVRALRLSGVFRKDDPAALLDALESGLGLRTVRLGVATLIYR
ncbi:FecR domain-containing protein, partial [Amaricoccus sp.]|uniref:FecR family protein n=1 Tax=Amaricoccus sp. TaxID=1872485 RepID=UPI002CD95CDD